MFEFIFYEFLRYEKKTSTIGVILFGIGVILVGINVILVGIDGIDVIDVIDVILFGIGVILVGISVILVGIDGIGLILHETSGIGGLGLTLGVIGLILELIGGIGLILLGIGLILLGIGLIFDVIRQKINYLEKQKKIKKDYPQLSIIGIMRQRKDSQKFQTIYLLLIVTIIYILASKFFNFVICNIFLGFLLGSILLIVLESLIFNYRINRGWYGSNESEAREIINFILKNSEDVDFTDGDSPKSIIKSEDIQQVIEELGIQIPGYPEPNAINKSFSE